MVAVVIILLILFILVPMVLGGLFLTCTWPFDKTKRCIVSKINDGEIDSDFFEGYLKEEVLDVADLPSSITESEYDDVVDHFGDNIKDDKLREAIATAGIVIIADDGDGDGGGSPTDDTEEDGSATDDTEEDGSATDDTEEDGSATDDTEEDGAPTDDTEEDGALTGYDIVGDREDYGEWWLQYTAAPNKPPRGFSLEQCGQACDADSSCTKISYSATHGICLLSKSDATLFDEYADPSFKAYEKVTGGV